MTESTDPSHLPAREGFNSKNPGFMHACGHQCQFQPSLDGPGVVPLGFRSSRLTKAEFSDLIELIYAFGAQQGVTFREPKEAAMKRIFGAKPTPNRAA